MNSSAARRALIAQRSPIQKQVDDRPRCQECARVLTYSDFLDYWDGQEPHTWRTPEMSSEEYRRIITPRICIDCCDRLEAAERGIK